MYLRTTGGLGDILNPTAGSALDCGFFAGGAFKKECWCLDHPTWCSESDYMASRAMADPSVYNTLRQPPVVAAPSGDKLVTPPASGEDAQSTVDELLADQMRRWQGQNTESMQETAGNLSQFQSDYEKATAASIPMWLWLAAGVGVFAVVAVGGGSPRRYGR